MIERVDRVLAWQVRHLNYATGGPPDLTRPSTVYTVLGNLTAAYGLGQTLDQLRRFLTHELQAGRLGHEQGEDLTAAIHDCEQALAHARDDARALSKATGDTQNAINAVYGPISPALGEAPLSQPELIEPKGQEHAPGAAADLAAEDFPLPITDALQAAPGSDPAPGGPAPALPARTAKKGV